MVFSFIYWYFKILANSQFMILIWYEKFINVKLYISKITVRKSKPRIPVVSRHHRHQTWWTFRILLVSFWQIHVSCTNITDWVKLTWYREIHYDLNPYLYGHFSDFTSGQQTKCSNNGYLQSECTNESKFFIYITDRSWLWKGKASFCRSR